MGIKFGEVDASQILENEFKIGVLERVLDKLMQKNHVRLTGLTQNEIEDIREVVADHLKKKYPNSGIEYKKK